MSARSSGLVEFDILKIQTVPLQGQQARLSSHFLADFERGYEIMAPNMQPTHSLSECGTVFPQGKRMLRLFQKAQWLMPCRSATQHCWREICLWGLQ